MNPALAPTSTPHPDAPAMDDVLRQPLAELVASQEQALSHPGLFTRAYQSSLYQKKWRAAGIQPKTLAGRAGLCRLPFIDGSDILAMNAERASIRSALLAQPYFWLTSLGKSGSRKWLPLSFADTAQLFQRVRRAAALLAPATLQAGRQAPPYPFASTPASVVLAMNQPMPHISSPIPYLWERADCLFGPQALEFIVVSLEMLPRNHWDRFAAQKRPEWLMASVENALALLTHQAGIPGQAPFPSLRRGIFWGGPLDGPSGARRQIAEAYGLEELYSLYFSAECREIYLECQAHNGLHLWMDSAIHEILPRFGSSEPGPAFFIDQVAPGTVGEYVVTTFSEALPLVRYRTGDLVEVAGTSPCACGLTHPRVRFLGRVG